MIAQTIATMHRHWNRTTEQEILAQAHGNSHSVGTARVETSGEVQDRAEAQRYDRMTLGALRERPRVLTVPQLVQLRTYEQAHANRRPVVDMVDRRIATLGVRADQPLRHRGPYDAADERRGVYAADAGFRGVEPRLTRRL